MKTSILTFLTAFFFFSCEEKKEKFEYNQFRKQITPGGKYIIYEYSRYGPMAFSSDISGTELFKIDEKFEEGKGHRIDGSICEWISNDTLLVYNFKSNLEQPIDTLPINTEYSKIGDFIIKTIFYKSNSGGRAIYTFDSVKTTDKLILIRVIENNKKKHFISFPLGGTTIKTKSDSIVHIEISTRLSKSMNFVYKNKDGTFTGGLPDVGTTWYDLTPAIKISPKGLNTKKIFWEE